MDFYKCIPLQFFACIKQSLLMINSNWHSDFDLYFHNRTKTGLQNWIINTYPFLITILDKNKHLPVKCDAFVYMLMPQCNDRLFPSSIEDI